MFQEAGTKVHRGSFKKANYLLRPFEDTMVYEV